MTPNFTLIRLMAAASAAAYSSSTAGDPRTGARANVTYANGVITVAFKGSQTGQDFLQDAKFWLFRMPPDHQLKKVVKFGWHQVQVHSGFHQDIDAIIGLVIKQVRDLLDQHPGSVVMVTGHSLGGALAVLGALDLVQTGIQPEAVITFGQPSVGDAAYRNLYQRVLGDKTLRVVNENDIVPRLPPMLAGYRQELHQVFLPAGGNGWKMDPPLLLRLFSDLTGFAWAFRHFKDVLVEDHFMTAYIKRLQLCAN